MNKTDPVLNVNARPTGGRASNSPSLVTYGFHYGMEQLGIQLPKRWNSTFATNSPGDSLYMDSLDNKGIRRIVLPEDRVVGFVDNDFNDNQYREFSIPRLVNKIAELMESKGSLYTWMMEFMRTERTSEDGFDEFHDLVVELDKFLEKAGQLTFTQVVTQVLQAFIESGLIGVSDFGDLPDGNYEVWFEGPYEAHLIDDTDTDGPDPHDLDR